MAQSVPIRSSEFRRVEVSWFVPLCNDDYEYLGVPDSRLKSNFKNTSEIVTLADRLGFNNILCPSSYQVGQDTLVFAAALAQQTQQIQLLVAIRCGELHPAMLARSIATLDHLLKGRFTINIISSDLPGETLESSLRYQKSREVIQILKQGWNQEKIQFSGQFYQLDLSTDPVKPYQQNGGPLLYFGGLSEEARELCAQECDVYLMWPDTEENLAQLMKDVSERAQKYGRKIDFGLRVHLIVRPTEAEAESYAQSLISHLDESQGNSIRNRALDSCSQGVLRQSEIRRISDKKGYVEPLLWTGIGKARSGCGCALVGNPDQILAKLNRYIDMGMRSFIFSGYPHFQECENIARIILPHLETGSLPKFQKRVPNTEPTTPLGKGTRL